MSVATYNRPDFTAQTATVYKTSIDGAAQVFERIAGAFAPHAAATPNMTVKVDAGSLLVAGALVTQAQQTTGTITAPVTNPRIDLVQVDQVTGAVGVTAGSEAPSPSVPAIPSGKLPVAAVHLTVGMTVIADDDIDDLRPAIVRPLDPEAAAVAFDNAASGLAATDVQEAIDELASTNGSYGLLLPETRLILTGIKAGGGDEPRRARTFLIDDTIAALIDAGIWAKLDLIYFLAAHDAVTAKINWKNPAVAAQQLTAVNSPTFAVDQGYTGNGSSSYLVNAVNMSALTQFKQNSAHIGVWIGTNVLENVPDIGISTGDTMRITTRFTGTGNNASCRINDASTLTSSMGTSTDSKGSTIANRSGSSARQLYKNASSIASDTQASVAPGAGTLLVLKALTTYSTKQAQIVHAGASLSSGEVTNLYTILGDYLAGL